MTEGEGTETLDLPVRSVMSSPIERIEATASVAEAAGRLTTAEIGSLLVGEMVGIVTESDVVASVSAGHDPSRTPVRSVMTAPVVTVTADATLWTVVERMSDRDVKKLPVTDGREAVGIVTTTDVTAVLAPDLEEFLEAIPDE